MYSPTSATIFKLVGKPISLIPHQWLKPPIWIANYMFGVNNRIDKKLLKGIVNDTDTRFLKWAIIQILSNELIKIPENLIRIHGKQNKLIPAPKTGSIMEGGHFMIVTHAPQIRKLILG